MRAFSLLFFVFFSFIAGAQHFCYTTEAQNQWFEKHPEKKAEFERLQALAIEKNKLTATLPSSSLAAKSAAAGPIYTVPVVFHILHTGGSENISDAQVQDAVNILTRDFNKLNADTSNVVNAFKNIIGNTRFEFKLASIDPNGNCTNGIIRHWDAKTDWTGDFADYLYTWPPHKYMNVYVVRTMGNGAAGYTFLPGSGIPSNADAIVILNGYVGSIGTGNVGLSRALTHEVGHWFSLPHTWGGSNQPGVACGDDGINDTPITKGFTFCNLNGSAVCNAGIQENVQNYMDYAYCQKMFTQGQSLAMQACINGVTNARNNLSSPSNLLATGITNPLTNCVPMVDITASPAFSVCSGKTLSFLSFTFNANPTSIVWSANNGALVSSPNATSTSINFLNPGSSTVVCTVSNAFGMNSKSLVILAKNGVAEVASLYSQSFENTGLPANWTTQGINASNHTWQIYNGTGSHGNQCVFVPAEDLPANAIQLLEGPSYDFKNNPGALYTFKYAYAKHNPANNDVFKVQASKNCGGSWSDVWIPSSSTMAGNSAGINSNLFVPYNEWVLYDLTQHPNFFPFINEDNVRIRFYFKEDENGAGFGNRLYLDEINFTTPTGINEVTKALALQVYPNPSNGASTLAFTLSDASQIKLSVYTVGGLTLYQSGEMTYRSGEHQILLNEKGEWVPGIYFVCLEYNGTKLMKKLVVE